jgi:phage N-6-adenine-methyltransferase
MTMAIPRVTAITLVPRADDPDAIIIGDLYRKARSSIVDSVRYLVEMGQRLTKKKEEVGHGNWLPWLKANADVLGFDTRMTASRFMRVADKCNASVTFGEDEALAISREIWGHHNVRGTQGTGENEWCTPPKYIELARAVLGDIDLDPATNAQAQEIIRATRYFTKADNGLAHEWHGRTWLNPPYETKLIAKFVKKLCAERKAGRVTAAIMLTHNYTETRWFQEADGIADAICLYRRRIRFFKPDGTLAKPTQGQVFFYFGDNVRKFASIFRAVGRVHGAALLNEGDCHA